MGYQYLVIATHQNCVNNHDELDTVCRHYNAMFGVHDIESRCGHRFMQRAVSPSSGRVLAFQDGGGVCRYPSTGRRRQTGRPNARPRTGCITRRTYVLRIIFKVLRLVYYCASVGVDFYSFSYRTSCDLVARDQNLSPLAQPGFWR